MNTMDADLFAAASVGNLDAIMTRRQKINQVTEGNHETVLHLAALSNVSSCVAAIIDEFPSLLDEVNSKNETALHLAAIKGCKDVVDVLISKSEQFNLKDFITKGNKNLDTALHLAARSNHEDLVRLLVKADPSYEYTQNSQSETPLYLAATTGNVNMIKTIFDNCRNASPDGPEGKTALHAAVISQKSVCIEVILQNRGELYGRADNYGWTAFHHAASLKCEAELDWLIELGNPNMREEVMAMTSIAGKGTALHIAALKGHTFIVLQLMEYCQDSIGTVDEDGRNILHIAAERNHKELFNSILHFRHCDISNLFNVADNKNGNTPLHLLVLAGCYVPEFVSNKLVKKDIKNNSGFTPVQLLYADEEIIGDQLKIRKVLADIPQSDPKFQESVVLKSKRKRKNAKFLGVYEKGSTEKLKSYRKMIESQLVVTALIATVTFTVGFTMPGGYHDGDTGDADNGMAILSQKNAFRVCMIADAVGLLCSVSCLLFYFYSFFFKDARQVLKFTTASVLLNLYSVLATMITFICGMYVVLSNAPALANVVTAISLFFFVYLTIILYKLQQRPLIAKELKENWV